jgi:hypothetical protein
MATLPQFMQRKIARRSTSDIGRLAEQYKSSIAGITGDYQKSFQTYQAGVAEKMQPYEAQVAQYKNVAAPTYESQKAAYQTKLNEYNKVVEGIKADPITVTTGYKTQKKTNYQGWLLGQTEQVPYEIYTPKAIPKFTEAAPVAPDIPVAPDVGSFDQTAFDEKRKEAEGSFKREVGERKSARISAVSRKSARPLLSGAA